MMKLSKPQGWAFLVLSLLVALFFLLESQGLGLSASRFFAIMDALTIAAATICGGFYVADWVRRTRE